MLAIDPQFCYPFGTGVCKVDYRAIAAGQKRGRLILVSAITPTPTGEGKTTTAIGLAQGLKLAGKSVALALREPSLGPLFGFKGGATGGGRAHLKPAEKINLHFTGDFSAVTAANNLLAAAIDNAIFRGELEPDESRNFSFPRVLDLNDRSLRRLLIESNGEWQGSPRRTRFDITPASEVMAILCLAESYSDLKERLSRIVIAIDRDGRPLLAGDLKVAGAMAVLLKDAIHPNLVSSEEGVPALVHGGPFANIAHGSNSILATRLALAYSDYVVTEAGFSFDLGGEKFLDIVSPVGKFWPALCVLVATVRALKMHGGVAESELNKKDVSAVERGLSNLEKQLENIRKFGLSAVVAVNRFAGDDPEEIAAIVKRAGELGVCSAVSDHYERGGAGAAELAECVLSEIQVEPLKAKPLYPNEWSIEEKITTVAREMYGAGRVEYHHEARSDLEWLSRYGYDALPVCIAKTSRSLSDNPELLGRPEGFTITLRRIELAAGAGFTIPIIGEILRMPGLPPRPAYEKIDLGADGEIRGLQ